MLETIGIYLLGAIVSYLVCRYRERKKLWHTEEKYERIGLAIWSWIGVAIQIVISIDEWEY